MKRIWVGILILLCCTDGERNNNFHTQRCWVTQITAQTGTNKTWVNWDWLPNKPSKQLHLYFTAFSSSVTVRISAPKYVLCKETSNHVATLMFLFLTLYYIYNYLIICKIHKKYWKYSFCLKMKNYCDILILMWTCSVVMVAQWFLTCHGPVFLVWEFLFLIFFKYSLSVLSLLSCSI